MQKRCSSERTSWDNELESLDLLNHNACGIDIGATSHWVSVPAERDTQSAREFGCYTPDLEAMAAWLKQCQIETVAMESTGVYWIPVFQIPEAQGFEVILVNAGHAKSVPGRKSDVLDCQWLRQLHSYGLLAGSCASGRPNLCATQLYPSTRYVD